jgi:hypothetical protein
MRIFSYSLLCVLIGVITICRGEDICVSDVAVKVQFPEGAAGYGDVCFASHRPRPINADDPRDTIRDAKAYHATRIEWCLSFDEQWIKKVRDAGFYYGGELNANLADRMPEQVNNPTYAHGRICDVKGNLITAPWMSQSTPKPYWGCVNSPDYRGIYLESAKKLIDAGVNSIQTDDPMANMAAFNWGGCFCRHCVAKAAINFVELNDPDQRREFARKSVEEFYRDMHERINELSGGSVLLSSNNFGGVWDFPYSVFDSGIAHYDYSNPANLIRLSRYASAAGKHQSLAYRTKSIKAYRRMAGFCYAAGLGILCPYDTYLRSTPQGTERLFIEPEKIADIFGFIRGCRKYLDGYEEAAVDVKGIEELRYEGVKPLNVRYKDIYGIVRAIPSKPLEPVAIHLIDWNGANRPFSIEINNANFFNGLPFEAKLLMPVDYAPDVHARASEDGRYQTLVAQSTPEQAVAGGITTIRIPAINPYAIVVLQHINEQAQDE